jgi:hypothetical protein
MGWRWQRIFSRNEVPFEAQPIEHFLAVTPDLFKHRPMGQSQTERSGSVNKYAKESMSADEAQSIVDYYNNDDLFEHVTPQSQANLLSRFRNGYSFGLGAERSQGAFQFYDNIDEGIRALIAYDEVHQTNHAIVASLLAIKNISFVSVRESGHWIFQFAFEATMNDVNPTAITYFVTTLAKAKSPEGFGALPESHLYIERLLEKVSTGKVHRPANAELLRIVKRMIYFRLWYAQTDGWSKVETILGQAIHIATVTTDSIKNIWGEHSPIFSKVRDQMELARQILDLEIIRIHNEWIANRGLALRGTFEKSSLRALEKALDIFNLETMQMPENPK